MARLRHRSWEELTGRKVSLAFGRRSSPAGASRRRSAAFILQFCKKSRGSGTDFLQAHPAKRRFSLSAVATTRSRGRGSVPCYYHEASGVPAPRAGNTPTTAITWRLPPAETSAAFRYPMHAELSFPSPSLLSRPVPQHSPLRSPFRSWSRGAVVAANACSGAERPSADLASERAQDPALDAAAVTPDLAFVSRANDSLGRPLRWAFFAFMAGVSLTIAATFTLLGAWPILAWSVVELTRLPATSLLIERRLQDWERLTVVGDRVIVERMTAAQLERREFNRVNLADRGIARAAAARRKRAAADAALRRPRNRVRRRTARGAARRARPRPARPGRHALGGVSCRYDQDYNDIGHGTRARCMAPAPEVSMICMTIAIVSAASPLASSGSWRHSFRCRHRPPRRARPNGGSRRRSPRSRGSRSTFTMDILLVCVVIFIGTA